MAAGALGVLVWVGSVEAYRLKGFSPVPVAADAFRWSPEVWGPGRSLVFEVAPDPDWEVYWDSAEAVLPYVERALNAWSGIATADISWRIVGVGEEPEARGDLRRGSADGRNTISIHADSYPAYAALRSEHGEAADSPYEFVECDVALNQMFAQIPEDVGPEDIEDHRERRREWSVYVLVHEFGHCLGLNHSDNHSSTVRWDHRRGLIHPHDPAMSSGSSLDKPEDLAADERVGASLLRPVLPATASGSVSGVVSVDGEPASYAHVWALPSGPAPLRDRIGVFTDGDGAFLLEGLEPGDYAFWAQPIASHAANDDLLAEGAVWELTDTVVGHLTRVQAGATTANVEIPMRRSRAPRPPPDEVPPEWKRRSLTSMRRVDAEVCPGLRVEAERPYPADGPLWFSRSEFSTGRDQWFATTVTLAWSPRADNTVLDWAGPYRDWSWRRSDDGEAVEFVPVWGEGGEGPQWGLRSPFLDVAISDYRIEKRGSVARHTIEFAWPGAAEATLRFRSADGSSACDGEPRIACNVAGCELRR